MSALAVPLGDWVGVELQVPMATRFERFDVAVATALRKGHVEGALADARARQSELARTVGVGQSHICLILSGKRMPSLLVAKKIADYLGITLDELFEGLVGRVTF